MFPGAVSQWSEEQIIFVHLCGYYHNIMNEDKKPDDYTFAHDVLLERWVDNKKKQEKSKKGNGRQGRHSASNHAEIIEFG